MWTNTLLRQTLQDSKAVISGHWRVEPTNHATDINDAILITFADQGDLEVHLSVCGEQILASVLLWPVSLVRDPAAFNAALLRDHKLLPLSTFGITPGLDEDWYELFGALSAGSTEQSVLTEIDTLGENALEVTEAYADWLLPQ